MNETIYLKKLEQREIKPTAIRLLILKTMMQHKEAFSLLDLENELDTVINQLDKIKNGDLAVIIDCGCDDFFLEVNKAVHEKLLKKKINHDFIIRPGGHTGRYWNNAIDYQILFFSKFFNKSK